MSDLRNDPVQARSAATLERILDAARFLAQGTGYDRFTTAHVADRAGVSIGTVYRYFPDRVAILDVIDTGRRVAADVRAERGRQNAKWGEQNHPDGTGPDVRVLEHVDACASYFLDLARGAVLADAAKLATDSRAADGTVTWLDITLEEVFEAMAESDPRKLRTELVQASAVMQQWAEAIDRRFPPTIDPYERSTDL
ncbi:TetR/AcrR family transcriptional regulator [Curtobacterium sp. C1]|uniref:TetR/AcrR family transcriptional regulator n=1 Tax=Curtobacterium sp. C1 TaxID=2898151 RepID=UPI001E4EF59F|nr:TetR/AcrR family transcriptional regulator [Curtobacterium sp. C1]UFU14584.1 TetR/AcrR family transcriptional regulator [Curtobacterium sp. C1]